VFFIERGAITQRFDFLSGRREEERKINESENYFSLTCFFAALNDDDMICEKTRVECEFFALYQLGGLLKMRFPGAQID
jgi:hypothetical protein